MNKIVSQTIEAQKDELAHLIVNEQWARHPEFIDHYGERGQSKCVQDVKYNLVYLSQALAVNSTALFANYVDWLKTLFAGLNIPIDEIVESLTITRDLLQNRFPESKDLIGNFIDQGLQHLSTEPNFYVDDAPSQTLSTLRQDYLASLLRANRSESSRLILNAVAQGVSVKDIYLFVFQASQYEIGRLWQMNQISVAQEHYCTAVTQLIMSQLYIHIFNTPKNGRRLVATCVGGELHEMGVRMVADFFELDGWDTYYLGANTPKESIIKTLIEYNADVLAVSVTMISHIKSAEDLIQQVGSINTAKKIKILIGGYPFNIEPNLWQRIGADGYANNAEQAVIMANELINA